VGWVCEFVGVLACCECVCFGFVVVDDVGYEEVGVVEGGVVGVYECVVELVVFVD